MSIQSVLNNERTWHVETTDVLAGLRALPDGCVQCCVTSPPYFALRDYGVDGQIGLEETPEKFVAKLVEVFAEVRRVLRKDGTCWVNMGDSYNGQGERFDVRGVKKKDLLGMPWQLAFALRADGWYLRSEIIWHKRSPMPESVTDRPTKAHEQIFLFANSQRYFYDPVASAEPVTGGTHSRGTKCAPPKEADNAAAGNGHEGWCAMTPHKVDQRNMRSVWSLSTEPFAEAHFATYPTELVRRCLLAGTSERGSCAKCGEPLGRLTKRTKVERERPNDYVKRDGAEGTGNSCANSVAGVETVTLGWRTNCNCNAPSVPCIVLDPFNGAGTTGVVARRLGLRYIGFELNAEYAAMARRRIRDDQPLLNAS